MKSRLKLGGLLSYLKESSRAFKTHTIHACIFLCRRKKKEKMKKISCFFLYFMSASGINACGPILCRANVKRVLNKNREHYSQQKPDNNAGSTQGWGV